MSDHLGTIVLLDVWIAQMVYVAPMMGGQIGRLKLSKRVSHQR